MARLIVGFARQHNVTRIVIGKPVRRRMLDLFRGSPVDRLVRESGEIDVHVIKGQDPRLPQPRPQHLPIPPKRWQGLLTAGGIVAACTAACYGMVLPRESKRWNFL